MGGVKVPAINGVAFAACVNAKNNTLICRGYACLVIVIGLSIENRKAGGSMVHGCGRCHRINVIDCIADKAISDDRLPDEGYTNWDALPNWLIDGTSFTRGYDLYGYKGTDS